MLIIIREKNTKNKKNGATFLRFIYDTTILNLLESRTKNLYSLFPTYFLESYILHIGIIPCPFISSVLGHPIHLSFSLPLEKARTDEWMCTKNRGWRKRKKGAKKAAGEEETPGWINGRNIKRRGEGKIERNEALHEKAAVAARYRSLAPFASHLTLRIRDMMLEY